MDVRLERLIDDYRRCVAEAVAVLQRAGIPLPASNTAWTGMELANGELLPGYRFFKHGFGCSVKGPGVTVDFDFGTAGQSDRFDVGRLKAFASRRADTYGFVPLTEIDRALAEATKSGEVAVDIDGLSYVTGYRAL
jgi:hypothetical protein